MTGSAARPLLDEVLAQYRVSLEIADPAQIHALFGAIAANMDREERPVWLIFVGPPSSGKSDPLRHIAHLPDVHFASEITQGGLLSCSPTKGKGPKGNGGLLTSIGEFGILVVSDLSPTLCLGDDRLGQFLSLMREVYDGKVVRYGGQDGGMRRAWTGKLGMIAAATGDIDRHHSVINTLGDRYLYFRMATSDVRAKMERARRRVDNRKAIASAVTALFTAISASKPPELSDQSEETLQSLATFVAVARTAVTRDPRNRKVEEFNTPEEPTRLYLTFRNLLGGLQRIGLDETEAMGVTTKVALDSIPRTRLAIIKQVLEISPLTVKNILAGPWFFSPTSVHRALEELSGYRILDRTGANGVPAAYTPSPWLSSHLAQLPSGTFSDICLISWKEEIRKGLEAGAKDAIQISEKVNPLADAIFGGEDTENQGEWPSG